MSFIQIGILSILAVLTIVVVICRINPSAMKIRRKSPSEQPQETSTATPSKIQIWIQKEQWHIGGALVAYVFFWMVLRWYFPRQLSEPATDFMFWVGGLLILTTIGAASPKWSARLICLLLLLVTSMGMINRAKDKQYIKEPNRPVKTSVKTTAAVMNESRIRSVTIRKGEVATIRVPTNLRRESEISPTEATVKITLPNGKVVTDYGYKNVVFTTPRTSGDWQEWKITTEKEYPVTYTATW